MSWSGSLHVANIQSGQLVDTSKFFDYSIVNPINLSIELQNELCSRCHVQGNSVLKYEKSFDFKPGMYLNEVMDVCYLDTPILETILLWPLI